MAKRSKELKKGNVFITSTDLRKLGILKHEMPFTSEGNIELTSPQLRKIFAELTKRDIRGLSDPYTREKLGRAYTQAKRKNVLEAYMDLLEVMKAYDPKAKLKPAGFLSMHPAYSNAKDFGITTRQAKRWINRSSRPSKGVRKHIRRTNARSRGR